MGESINLVNNFNVRNVIFNIGSYNEIEEELNDINAIHIYTSKLEEYNKNELLENIEEFI